MKTANRLAKLFIIYYATTHIELMALFSFFFYSSTNTGRVYRTMKVTSVHKGSDYVIHNGTLNDGILTYWGRENWPPFCRQQFQIHFHE